MPSDYDEICKDNIRRRGEEFDDIGRLISEQLYSDRSHFIFELLQNAEDALARRIRQDPENSSGCAVQFRLFPDKLEFRHFGVPFGEDDVRGVSDVLKGTKKEDVSQIGKFGIGFKSVYAFSASPEIHSGDEHFAIKRYIRPEAKDPDHLLAIAPNETVFVFPFDHEDLSAPEAFGLILDKLRRLGPRVLLFLRRIDEIAWRVESDGEEGQYLKETRKIGTIGNARRTSVIGQKNGQEEEENWIVFERPVTDSNEVNRVSVEIAYRTELDSDRKKEGIVSIDRSPLVVYFPTQKDTRLGFLIQGPYRTTTARENILSDCDWNKELISETAELAVESLRKLKEIGMLSVSALSALPIKFIEMVDNYSYLHHRDGHYYAEFQTIYTKVREALLNEDLLPANDGTFVSARTAKLARSAALMDILNHERLGILFQSNGEIKWLSVKITQDRTPDLRSYLTQELNVEEVDPEVFARKLSEHFLVSQDEEWLIEFYEFLLKQEALWRPPISQYETGGILRTMPILRLQDGTQVNPFRRDGTPNAYLAVGEDTETSLPVVNVELTLNRKARVFLKQLGIPELDIVAEVIEQILPKYTDDLLTINFDENLRDLSKIDLAYNTDSQEKKERLRKKLQETPFILAEHLGSGETGYRKPNQVYFSTCELRGYFCDNKSIAFASSGYPNGVIPFLRELGVSDRIRISCKSNSGSTGDVALGYKGGYRRGLNGFDPDIFVHGLEYAIKNPSTERSGFIWNKIASPFSHCIKGEILIASRRDFSPNARTYKIESTVSNFGELLRTNAWLPGLSGNMHKPSELTLDDLPALFVRDETLAAKLGMKIGTVAKLAKEIGVEAEDIELIRQNSEEFSKWKESVRFAEGETKPSFPIREVKDVKRRNKRLLNQLRDAPEKEYLKKQKSDRVTHPDIDPTTYLKNQYTNDQDQMICQICTEEMPFKKRDGEYYFEAVEAFTFYYFHKEHNAQFLALCPLCAAMYKEFIKRDESAMENLYHSLKESRDLEVPLESGELHSVKFVETHWRDMKTVLEAMGESDSTSVNRSDAWSEEDTQDLTKASLSYATRAYPEEEDLDQSG